MVELPTKQTLDDIEKFGISFNTGFTAMQNLFNQNLAMAKRYIIIDEVYDESGNRTSYTWNKNMDVLYTETEKVNILAYYDFLKATCASFSKIENLNGISIYDLANTRVKLDAIIASALGSTMVG